MSTTKPSVHTAMRLDAEIVARVDALLPLYSAPWRASTRSDALRAVILAGLPAEEARFAAMAQPSTSAKPKKK